MSKFAKAIAVNKMANNLIEVIATTDIAELKVVHTSGYTLSVKKTEQPVSGKSTIDFDSEDHAHRKNDTPA